MTAGNPAGPAVWFIALESGSEEIAGTASLMPRRLNHAGKEVDAGILGDFMVAAKHRVFGPNIQLLRTVLASLDDLGISFIYTLPNEASVKVAEHVGMKRFAELHCFVKPIDMRFYAKKYLPSPLDAVLAPAAAICLRAATLEPHMHMRHAVRESGTVDEAFDRLWNQMKEVTNGLISERSAEFLRWRYLQNPLNRFRVLVCVRGSDRDIGGYAFFCADEENKLEVYDIMAVDGECSDSIIMGLIDIGRRERRRALQIFAPSGSPRLDRFKRFRFFDSKSVLYLYGHGGAGVPLDSWDFSSGDRNI
jgi:hypothetical protein